MTVANPTPCETAVSKILITQFGELPEHERWFVAYFCNLAPASWIAEEISRLRSISELLEAMKSLGLDPNDDDNELRAAMADASKGKEVQKVADALARKRADKKSPRAKKTLGPGGSA